MLKLVMVLKGARDFKKSDLVGGGWIQISLGKGLKLVWRNKFGLTEVGSLLYKWGCYKRATLLLSAFLSCHVIVLLCASTIRCYPPCYEAGKRPS
jgi:hypothetical protein